MRKTISFIALAAASALVLSGCASADAAADADASSDGDVTTIGFLAAAPRNDNGLTQYSLAGVQAAVDADETLELTSIVDNVTTSQEQIQGLESLAADNDIVIADSAALNKAVEVVAAKYPDTTFILVAADLPSFAENVTSVIANVGYPAFVAGAVAASRSATKELGVIAGLELPATAAWYYGMRQGAQLQDPSANVSVTYTGDFNDVGKAKSAAEAMMANGVDSIISDLDAGSAGVYQAADAATATTEVYDVFALHCESSSNIVGSGTVSWSKILQDAVTQAAAGDLPAGSVSYGLKNGALKFEFCPGMGTDEQVKIADDVTQQLINGDIELEEGVLLPKPDYDQIER
ncbi:MAG TPA: BMP family ABC transporter substrate-binding protein [Microbacterium sp.]|uniref:BMP family lipoprotein n=1 Tax=Microbacterium sp. TaxID=51671 RepID=UPI002F9242FA